MANVTIKLQINPNLYVRDPQSTALGQRIVQRSIVLIDELGFEQFTFRKLAQDIKSTEASIYRYFENKHSLLVYLVNWYWEWMKFRLDFNTMNIRNPIKRLKIIISCIVDTAKRNTSIEFVDEDVLHRIVVAEGTKAYHTKEVDEQNRYGFFLSYKSLSEKIAKGLLDVNPEFPYPRALASNLLEMANNQVYFAQHLPRLTDIQIEEQDLSQVIKVLEYFTFQLLLGSNANHAETDNSIEPASRNGASVLEKRQL